MLLRWLINAVALLAITQILQGFEVSGLYIALIAALVLGLVNAVIRPVLLFFTFPVTVLTLGLSVFAVNALLLWFVSSFIQGFAIADFWTALAGAVILWAIGMVTNWFIKQVDEK